MKRKIFIILIFIALIIIPIISATTQQINVKTNPNYRILISVYKSEVTPAEKIISFPPYKDTGSTGALSVSLTTEEKKVDIKLDLKKGDMPIIMKDFLDVQLTGEPVFINMFPPDNMTVTVGNPVQNITPNITIENITVNQTNTTLPIIINTTNTTTLASNDTSKTKFAFNFSITGYASKFYEDNSKTLFYILIVIGVIVGILIIIFIIRRIPKRQHYSSSPPPLYHRPAVDSGDKSLAEAEKKLRIAQEEIEKIKNRNQNIREAERKFEEDRIRLDKLRRGY